MAVNPGELFKMPNGEAVYYVDADHSYWRCKDDGKRGTRLTGVTTVTKTLDYDPGRLLNWAAKVQCIGVAELYAQCDPEELHWLSTQESIWAELEAHELDFENVRDRAAKRGTNVHEMALRALAMGRPVPDLEGLTEEEQGYARGVMKFWLDEDPQVEQVEQIVYSSRLGVAGRLDLRGKLKSFDSPGVLDAKTGRWISAAAHAQVGGGYPLLAGESGFGESDWALILQLTPDGDYDLLPAQGTPEGFEAAVVTYREAGRINREAGKARKAAQTRRETQEQIDKAVAV
jgi:hypothetical protein